MPSLIKTTGEVSRALFKGVTDRETSFARKLHVLGGFTASGLRFAAGMSVKKLGPRPQQRLILWDFERCPHSRIVREALSALDLDADVRPCPRNGTRFRPQLQAGSVPQLQDPNHGGTLVGSQRIVQHLHTHYGVGRPPRLLNLAPIRIFTGLSARLLTGGRGAFARPSRAPHKPLELWSFEASPYCRFVRFTLCELELPYVLHNVGKGSPRRDAFVALSGKMQIPWLHDPNTGTSLFESRKIEDYLLATYGSP